MKNVYIPINVEVQQAGDTDVVRVHSEQAQISEVLTVTDHTPKAQYDALNALTIKAFNPAGRGMRVDSRVVQNFKKAWGIR